MVMPWIGVLCKSEAWELERWAAHVRAHGGSSVADLLGACADLVSGKYAMANAGDRMAEVEARAAAAVERARAAAAARAAEIVGRAAEGGAGLKEVMAAAGADGWKDGSAAGEGHGGTARRRRKFPKGRAAGDGAGGIACAAQAGEPPLTPASEKGRDARYGATWEGWAGVELVKAGFKMRHVARGTGLDLKSAWRHVSGWSRHWRREGLVGRQFPGPAEGWAERLAAAKSRAMGEGVKGAKVVLNGTGDLGIGKEEA